ncbi:hypothetical protein OROHE_011124 [Orobanche hederae]
MEAEEILTYIKSPQNGSVCYFSSKLDVPSNVVQKKKVARIMFFKIRPSQEILKIRDGTPLELDVPSNVVQKKRVARILFFKIRPSQEILKIRDGTPLEAEEILTYIKSPRNESVCYFSSKLDVPSNVVQKKKVARIMFFKIRPSQEILKIRDGTPLEAEEILTYIKSPRNGSVCYFSSKLDVPSNLVQKKRLARILFFKIRSSQEILNIRDGTPLEAEEIFTYIKSPRNGSVCYFSSKLDVPSNVVQKKRVARILFFKIRPSQEILKIRDGTPLEAEEILTYIKALETDRNFKNSRWYPFGGGGNFDIHKKPSKRIGCYFSSKLDVLSNVVQKKRLARILFFKIRPSQEILKIRDGTPLEAEEFLTYIKSPRNGSFCYFSSKLDVPSNVVQKKRVARIPFFKIRPSQEILKIRDGTPLEAEEILTYIKRPRNGSVCYFSSKLDVSSNVVQNKKVARILSSQGILKIRDGTPMEAEEILTYIKSPRNGSVCYFSSKLDVPNNVVQKKKVARILFFKIRPSQEILKIRDGTPLEAEEIFTYIKRPRNGSVLARILFFKIKLSQGILKIRDVTPMEAEEILTYIKSPRNGSVCYFSSKLDVPSNVVQKKRVARIMFFKIRPSQEILKIRDGTPLEAEKILTYIKRPRNGSVCYFSSKLDVPSNVVQKKRVARILFFKIKLSQEILKIRDGTPMEAEEILTYIKSPRNGSGCYFSSKLDVPSNVVQKKRVARILFFKIRPSQEILKFVMAPLWSKLDVPSNVVQKKRVAQILFFKIRPSQEILKIRDGTPLEAEEILTYIKRPRNGSVLARILFFKFRPSQEILKIRDGTPFEAEEILTYIKSPRNGSVCYFSSKLDVPSNVVQKKRVARILFFKIKLSQEILKIRDGTPMEAEEILTYIKSPPNGSGCYFSSKLDVPSNVVQKKRVARILFFKIRPSQEILKIRDGTPVEAEKILTYIKRPRNGSVCYFSSKLDVPSNVVQKKRVAQILFFKIRPSQEILKIRDGTPLEAEEILTYIKRPRNGSAISRNFKNSPSQEILKIRDGTPFEAEEILTYIKSPRNGSVCFFSSKLDVPSNVVQKKRVARILFFKIKLSQEILKIRDGTPMEAEEILTYIKSPPNGSGCYFSSKLDVPSNVVQKKRVARILFFKIRPSQEILKIRDGTPVEAEKILTYIKRPRNGSVCYFSSKLDVPSNVVQKKRVAQILFFKIRPSQEILKIRDGTPLEAEEILTYIKRPRNGSAEEILTYIKSPRNGSVCYFSSKLDVPSNVVQKKRVAWILFFKIKLSQEILKIRDGTPMEAEEILTYIKSPRNGSGCYFSSKLDVPSNVVQKKRVARILFFKIRPSQEILKFVMAPLWSKLDVPSNVVQKKRVAQILFFKIRPSQEILKIRDGTPLEAEEILTYIKRPRNGSVCYFSSKLDVPSNVVQKKRVARILFYKIRPSQEILKIRDGTPLEAQEILTYIKIPRNGSVFYFSSKLDVPSNVVQKKRVARILFFKIRPSQEILKFVMLDVPSNVVQKKRVAQILFFKIRPSQEILKIRDGTPLEAEEILAYIKRPRNGSLSQEILKIRDGTPMEAEEILTYIKSPRNGSGCYFSSNDGTPLEAEKILTYIKRPRNGSVCYFSSKLDVPSNVVQKKRVAQILFFKIRPSQEILKIRDGTPLEAEEILAYIKRPRNGSAEEILTYIKSPRNGSDKLDVPSNVVQKKRVAQILFFKIRPSQEILKIRDGTPLEAEEILAYIKCPRNGSAISRNFKIRDGTPLEAEEILTYIKRPRNGSVCYFSSKLDVSSNVVQKKRVAQILFFKIRPSQEILKIRDGTPLEAEEILTYIKRPRNGSVCYFSSKPSQEILKIRDGTPFEAEEILTYIKSPRNGSVCYFSSQLDVPSNVVQKKRVARILFFKIKLSQEILKIRDGTPMEAEEILTYIKSPRNGSGCYFSSKLDVPSNVVQKKRLDVPSNVVQKKRVAHIMFFKIRPSQEILKIRDGTPLEAEEILTYIKRPRNGSAEEILTYIKSPRNGSGCYFSSKLDVPSNVVQKKRVARILFFKIRPSQEILKFVMVPLWSKLDVPSNVVQKKRVAQILFFKIRPSQEILKIRDGTPLEAEEILAYIKRPRNGSKRVARILFFKIKLSQEILKIRDGTPMEAEEILTYIKCPRNGSGCYFSSKLDVPSNVVQKKRVARILFFKIKLSQEILKIRDGTPMEAEEILTYIKRPRNGSVCYFSSKPSQEILKIRDGTPFEAEEILTYIKSPRNGSVCYFSSKLDVPSNVVQKKRVARIMFFKIKLSQEILKIRDGTPMEAEEILTYIKSPRNGSGCYFSSKLDVPSNVVQKKRVARIMFFKIRPSQEILKIRDGTPLEAEEILTYIKRPRTGSVCYFSSKLDVPSNVVQKKRVARILFYKIRPSQEILKIRDGTPLEAQEILTYIKIPRNGSVFYFSSKLDVPSNVVQKKRVARILFFKIRPSQEILKFVMVPLWSKLDVPSNVVQKKRVAQILFFKIRPSQEILKIRDGTPLEAEEILAYIKRPRNGSLSQEILKIRDGTPMEAEEILTYIKSPRNGSGCYFSSKLDAISRNFKIRDGTPLEAEKILTYIKRPRNGSVCYFSSKLDVPSNVVQKKRVAQILFFKIRPSQEILKIRDGTPLEAEEILAYIKRPRNGSAEEILTYIKSPRNGSGCYFSSKLDAEKILTYIKRPRNGSVCYFSSKLDVPSNVVQKKRVAQILFFKIRPSQEILKIRDGTPLEAEEILAYIKRPRNGSAISRNFKIRDGTPLEAEEILTYIKRPRNGSVCYFSSKLDVSSNVVQKKRVAQILFFKIRPSQEILKIRDGTPLEAEEILTYIKRPRNGSVCYFSSKPSQEILKIRDGTPFEAEEILTYIKSPRNGSVCYFSSKLDVPSNVVQKKRVARILFFKIKLSQEILKIRDGTPMEAEEILTYIKSPRNGSGCYFSSKLDAISRNFKIRDGTPLEAEKILTYIKRPRNGSVCYFSSKLDVPSNVVQKKRVAQILFFKIRPSQEILKIRDGTPLVAEEILAYIKRPRNGSVLARILFFKFRPSQEILKIRDGTRFEAEEILTYIKSPRNGSVCYFSSKLDVPSNVVQKKRVARILFFKIKLSQEILKIRDGTPMEAEEILTYIKSPRNGSGCYFSSKLDVPSNVVQKKRVARILFFKIRPSQEILKFVMKRVARILFFKIKLSQEILKIRDGTPMEAEEILTYIKCPRNGSGCYFSSKLDVPSNVVQKKRVARILFFKIKLSQEILKIRDGTPMEAEEILTYIKRPRNGSVCYFSSKPSQEILKIRDGTPFEAEEILTYIKSPRNGSVCYFSSKLDVPSNVVQKKRVARIMFFKIKLSQEILKIRDGTPMEAEEILTYIKSPRNGSGCYFSSKLDVPSNVVQKKRVARILFFKIRPSQEILKFVMVPLWSKLDVSSNVVQKKRVAQILFFKIRPSQEILKIRDGTPLEAEEILTYIKRPRNGSAEEILTYIKSPRNGSVCYFSSKLDVPSNVVQKKRAARILFFKIRPSQEILKFVMVPLWRAAISRNFKIRDGTPLEAEKILTYIKRPRNGSVCYFFSKLDVPSNVVQKKRVAQILFFKIRPSQEILKIRDGTHLEAEEILAYIKGPRNGSVCYFSSKLDVSSNVVQKKRVAQILFFKIRPSQEILKIRDGTPLEAKEILTYIKRPRNGSVCYFSSKPSQEILKIRDGTPFEAEEILTYIKSPRNGSVCYFSSKLDVPSNVVQKKRAARILFFKIRPSQEILKFVMAISRNFKIRDGTPLEAEKILTYIKRPRNGSVCYFFSKLDVPSNVVQKKRVAQILFFKIRPCQEILKIRDGTPLEAEEILAYIKGPRNGSVCYFSSKLDVSSNVVQKKRVAEKILTYIKRPRNGSVCYFSSKLDVPSNVVQKKRVAQILFFKIRPSQEILKIRDGTPLEAEEILAYIKRPRNGSMSSQGILKIRDGTPLEAEEILTYIKRPRNGSVCYFSSKLDAISRNFKIRDGTPLEAEKILTYIKRPRNGSVCYFSSKLDVPSNVVQKKRVSQILFFKIRPSQEILKIRDGTPLEAEEILAYIKRPRNGSVCYFSSKLDVSSNVVQKKKWHGFYAISRNFKIRDGTPLEAEEILTYIKRPRNGSVCYFSSKLDVSSNVVQKKRVARILFFKIRPSQEILKIRDGTPLEAEEILTYIKRPRNGSVCYFSSKPSQEILKIRDGTPFEAEEILTYIKSPRNGSVCYFSSKLDVPSNVVQKKRVARILFFKIKLSQEILKIRDGTPMEAEEILTYIKSPRNGSGCYFSSKLDAISRNFKIRDGTPLEAEKILTYIKRPRNGSVCYFSSKFDVSSNVVQKKRVARILFFKIRPSQEILKIRDGTPLEAEEILTYIKRPRNGSVLARILFFKFRPSQEILKIRDGTPFEAEEILTYIKSPRNGSVCYFSSKLDVPSNVVQKKRVARILFFKIKLSQEILKIRDGTPMEAEEILTYIKSPRNGSGCYFSSKLDVPSNVVQKKRVARILFFKIRPSQEILKFVMVPLWSKLDVSSNVVQKKRVARILFFKIRPSQEILKIRDGTPLEAEEILTYIKRPRNGSILFFKIRPSQEILKIRDGTPLEAEEILTYIKCPRNGSGCYFSSKLDAISRNFKIRDGTPLEAEEILTYIKRPRNGSVCYFSSKLDVSSNVVQKKRVAQILFFKIRPSQEILKIRDGTPLEAEEILTYIKSPRNGSGCYFSSKLDVPSNVVQKKRVARILFFKIRPSQEILKIRDGTPFEAEEILTYIKSPRNG